MPVVNILSGKKIAGKLNPSTDTYSFRNLQKIQKN